LDQANLSVTEPVSQAFTDVQRILFRTPFPWDKWFLLGFCAFLAELGSGDWGVGNNFGSSWSRHRAPRWSPFFALWQDIGSLYHAHPLLLALGVLSVGALVIGLWLVLAWLSCRGQFMLLDGVVRNRAAVAQPWREYAPEAHSLLAFLVILALLGSLLMLAALAICLRIAWPDFQRQQFGHGTAVALGLGAALLLPIVLVSGVVRLFLLDFVVPAMYQRRIGVRAGWGVVWREILADRPGTMFLYVLMWFALAIVVTVLEVLLVLCTCCCGALPYLGSVLRLPLTVFTRSYSLRFLEQFGAGWRLFANDPRYCANCNYDLTGNVSGYCPECGHPVPASPSPPPLPT
jgi:hypothetical protein